MRACVYAYVKHAWGWRMPDRIALERGEERERDTHRVKRWKGGFVEQLPCLCLEHFLVLPTLAIGQFGCDLDRGVHLYPDRVGE